MNMEFNVEKTAVDHAWPQCRAHGCWHHADSINDMCRIHAAFPFEQHSIVTKVMRECRSLIWVAQRSTNPGSTDIKEWNEAFNLYATALNAVSTSRGDQYPYAFPVVEDLSIEGAAEEALMAGLRARIEAEAGNTLTAPTEEEIRFKPIPYVRKEVAKL